MEKAKKTITITSTKMVEVDIARNATPQIDKAVQQITQMILDDLAAKGEAEKYGKLSRSWETLCKRFNQWTDPDLQPDLYPFDDDYADIVHNDILYYDAMEAHKQIMQDYIEYLAVTKPDTTA